MKDKISGIYCIENLKNRKKYIGLSNNVSKRMYGHKTSLRSNTHYNVHLHGAWNKYGEDNFKMYLEEECDINSLSEREMFYIKKYKTINDEYGYNLKGDLHNGVKTSDKTLDNMRHLNVII